MMFPEGQDECNQFHSKPPRSKKNARDPGLERKRLVRSTGHNFINTGVSGKNMKYFSDLYTTLLDIQWRWNILIFIGVFFMTWVIFACFYYLQIYLHGDIDNTRSANKCLDNVNSFTSAYLFSIETMTTIGYGSRSQTEACPVVYLTVLLQSILGAGLQFALASLVVSKTRRAKRRSETVLFSKHVCVSEQDTKLQLAVRVGNMRKSEIVGAHVRGFLIKKLRSEDGTMIPIRSFSLTFKSQCGRDDIFFPWPTQIVHTVDEESPLWSLSRDEFLSGKYELIVVLDGICSSKSSSFQARKSYHTNEMKWGYRFATLNVSYEDMYVIDLSNFHHTVPATTPLCSAQDINSLRTFYKAHDPVRNVGSRSSQSSNERGKRPHQKCGTHKNKNPITLSSKSESESSLVTIPKRSSHSVETHRSRSVEENRDDGKPREARRYSLGDLIRMAQGNDTGDACLGDAKNIYRHRKSVTDTYLGTDIEEECEDDYQAILSVVSQRSAGKRTDVRDVFKKRRNSVSKLFFGPETESSGDETDNIKDCSTYS